MKNYRVKELFQSKHSDDGRTVWARFNLADGKQMSLEFESDMLRQIQQYLAGVLDAAEAKSNLTMQGIVRAEGLVQWKVAPLDNDAVLLSVRTSHGLLHNFALPSKDALELSEKMKNAAQWKKPTPEGPVH